jgi:hypothetical protein
MHHNNKLKKMDCFNSIEFDCGSLQLRSLHWKRYVVHGFRPFMALHRQEKMTNYSYMHGKLYVLYDIYILLLATLATWHEASSQIVASEARE